MKVYYSTAVENQFMLASVDFKELAYPNYDVTLKLKDTEEREFIHSDKIFHLVYYVNDPNLLIKMLIKFNQSSDEPKSEEYFKLIQDELSC